MERVMNLATYGGSWRTENYKAYVKDDMRGCDIKLFFNPNDLVESPKIGLTQSVTPKKNGATAYVRPEVAKRANKSKDGDEGRYHDRADKKTNPIYGMANPTGKNKSLGSGTETGNSHWGKRTTDDKGTVATDEAWLTDQPKRGWEQDDLITMTFETTALAVEGDQKGTYYGSVEWGFKTDKDGNVDLLPFRVVQMGAPTAQFMASAKKWNSAKVDMGGGKKKGTQDLPVTSERSLSGEDFAKLTDKDLESRVKSLKKSNKWTLIKGNNYKQRAFEVRALEREARRRKLSREIMQEMEELLQAFASMADVA
jgi:hypothetical protein